MREAIIPSSRLRSTLSRASSPPNRFAPPRISSSAIGLPLDFPRGGEPALRLAQGPEFHRRVEPHLAAPGGQDALRAKDHHQNKNEAEDHAFVFRRLKLSRDLAQVKTPKQRQGKDDPGLAERIEPERKPFEKLQVQYSHCSRSQNGSRNRAHAAQDNHRQHPDRFHKGKTFRIDKDLLGRKKNPDRRGKGSADRKGQELQPHDRNAHRSRRNLIFADCLPRPADRRVFEPARNQDEKKRHQKNEKVKVQGIESGRIQPEFQKFQHRLKEEGRSLNRSNPLGAICQVYRLIEIIDYGANDFSKTEGYDSQIVPSEAQDR